MEDLIKRFKELSKEERLAFFKEIMPYIMDAFGNDPKEMMKSMMPFCMDMMRSKGIDMAQMFGMKMP